MHPHLFDVPVPSWLQGILPETIHVYSYGSLIALGAVVCFLFAYWKTRATGPALRTEQMLDLALIIIFAAVIGGKIFFYLEKPGYYLADPSKMAQDFGSGFVFYGSLLFAIPSIVWYFRSQRLHTWEMLDLIAFIACIIHFFGRAGCLMAGCCHGLPTDLPWALTFEDPTCLARPLGEPLHPTQVYCMLLILSVFWTILWFERRKKAQGQVFALYLMLYPAGRFVIEFFRGDEARGFVAGGLSHAQVVSVLLIAAGYVLLRWRGRYPMAAGSLAG